MPDLQPGLIGSAEQTVTPNLTAAAFGSGDVNVYATPALLALLEEAAVDAVRGLLPDDKTSVGTYVELEHLAPSKLGATVRATAELVAVEGRRLRFACEAKDGDTVVGRATHARAVVDRARFA